MKVEHSVIINLPPEEIFAYMSDLENMVDWSSVVISARKILPGAINVGAMVRGTFRFLGRWLDVSFEIVECKPNRYLTIKSISGVAPCLFYYRFDPVEDGRTAVSQEIIIHLTAGFLGLPESVVTSVIRRQIVYDLLTLKDLLEAGAVNCRNAG